MTRTQFFGCIIVILLLGLVGISEVRQGHELSALRIGQAELDGQIFQFGQTIRQLEMRIDNLTKDIQVGLASFYNYPFHGRRTANGEIYNKDAQTAAHRTARFGTWAVVENLLNGAKTIVRINDRGPFIDGRIIDLSEKGARDLGMIHAGVVPVKVYFVTKIRPKSPYFVTRAMPIARPGEGD
jgi:rare lipoprotein A (peptidoglycan hydrolase)